MLLVKKRVPFNLVTSFVAGVIVGGLIFGALGLRFGGARAFWNLAMFEHKERLRRAGLRRRS